MEDISEENKDLKKLFSSILGTEVNVKDNLDHSEEVKFKKLVDSLNSSNSIENDLMEKGIDFSGLTNPLWFIIEDCLKMIYGEDITDMVQWYIYDRFDGEGNIIPLKDPNNKIFTIKDTNDLWSYIKYKSFK